VLVSAVALCLGVAAAALGSFSPTITLSAGGQDAASPAVAVGAGGDGVAVWTRFDGDNSRVQARTVSPGGGLGPIQTLSAAGSSAFSPQVAVDADGDAVVVWTRLDGASIAQARRISSAGVLGPVLDLSPHGEDASGPQVAIDAGGNAIALWYRSNVGALQVLGRALPATGSPGPLLRLSSAAANGSQPRVGVTSGGGGYAVWVGTDGANSRAQGRSIDTAGNRGPVRFLSPAGSNAGFPRVDVDDSANAYAIWTRTIGANTRVEGRPVSAAGTLGTVTTLSAGGQNAILPAISIAGGNGVAVWARFDGANLRIQAVAVSATGGTGTPATVSVAGHGATNPAVAADANGNGQVVWQRSDGSNVRIQERPFFPAASPRPLENLSRAGADAALPAIAMNANGAAVAAWTRPDGPGHQRAEASIGP
jgi:hypothetical protein